MNRFVTLCSSLLLAACGGPLVTAELEAPQICHELGAIAFPGAPVVAEGTLKFEIPFELPAELQSDVFETETEVELLGITAIGDGVPDLGFIESAVVSANVGGEPVVLASYEDSAETANQIRFVPREPVDMRQLTAARSVPLETSLTGVLPASPWKLNSRLCHRVRAVSTYTP